MVFIKHAQRFRLELVMNRLLLFLQTEVMPLFYQNSNKVEPPKSAQKGTLFRPLDSQEHDPVRLKPRTLWFQEQI
jgi:hypothetical protein